MDGGHKRNKKVTQIEITYEKETDTLHIFAGDQRNSVARNIGNGILVQYNLRLKKPVGAIIHDFERRFKIEQEPLEIPVFV